MTLADITFEGDVSTSAQEALLFLLLVGGILFLLTSVVVGQNPVSSTSSRRKKSLSGDGAFGPSSLLQRPAEPQGLASAGRAQPSQGGKDKRRALRRGGNPIAVLMTDPLAPGDPVQGTIQNRSRGGLCLVVPHKLEVGQLLAVRTAAFPESLVSVQLRVRHCQPKGDGWRIGCQFVEELPWSIVLLFG